MYRSWLRATQGGMPRMMQAVRQSCCPMNHSSVMCCSPRTIERGSIRTRRGGRCATRLTTRARSTCHISLARNCSAVTHASESGDHCRAHAAAAFIASKGLVSLGNRNHRQAAIPQSRISVSMRSEHMLCHHRGIPGKTRWRVPEKNASVSLGSRRLATCVIRGGASELCAESLRYRRLIAAFLPVKHAMKFSSNYQTSGWIPCPLSTKGMNAS